MWGAPPSPPKPVMLNKPNPTPIACVRRRPGISYCFRDYSEEREFAFTDPRYAISHYRNSKVIRLCSDCATVIEAEFGPINDTIAPMATRGLKENSK